MIIALIRRLREKIIANKTLLFLGCITCFTDSYIYTNAGAATVPVTIFYLILTCMDFLLLLAPYFMSICYVFVQVSIVAIPGLHLPPMTFGLIVSLTLIAYLYPVKFTLPLLLTLYAFHYVAYCYVTTISLKTLIIYILMSTFFTGVGLILQIYHQKIVLSEQEKQTVHDLQLAVRMHDQLTNKIADIALQSKIALLDTSLSESQRTALGDIKTLAEESFEESHCIIDLLRNGDAQQDARMELIQQIKSSLKNNDALNKAQGLHGKGVCDICEDDIENNISDVVVDEILELIDELYLNMRKYASLFYRLDISINDDQQISIEQFNLCNSSSKDERDARLVSQKGLLLHRDIIERLGGSLEFHNTARYWECSAVFPMKYERI